MLFMNKLEGFYELRKSGLPAVPWMKYEKGCFLDPTMLWTIRSAVEHGDDLNLPRIIGVSAEKAHSFAEELMSRMKDQDLILYYPYFIAKKSGVIEVSPNRIVIEAVHEDLWNLVTYNNKDTTIIFSDDDVEIRGDETFFSSDELYELVDFSVLIRKRFSNYIGNGKSVFLEWSYACKSDINKNCIETPRLVFYEIRTV